MGEVRRLFETRKQEIESCINHVVELEHQKTQNSMLKTLTCIRASILLMLYNMVEAVMRECLRAIHNRLIGRWLTYDVLNTEIKQLLLSYFRNKIEKKTTSSCIESDYVQLIELLHAHITFDLEYDTLEKKVSLYSGNLDAKKIKQTLRKYGVAMQKEDSVLKRADSNLTNIKNWRNILAHGEKGFEEVGRDISSMCLRSLYQGACEYMSAVIDAVDIFLQEDLYMRRYSNLHR